MCYYNCVLSIIVVVTSDKLAHCSSIIVVVTSDKLATAQDFADITELADEGEEEKERLYQKGMMYVQAQTG